MAARAYWSGNIRLSLVSMPVDIVPATKPSAKIAFHQVHKPSGSRVKYQKVVPGVGEVETQMGGPRRGGPAPPDLHPPLMTARSRP